MEHTPDRLALEGTAVVYEGTVLFRTAYATGHVRTDHAQARAGGPARGDWSVVLRCEDVLSVQIFGEEMEEGPRNREDWRITIPLSEP